MSLSRESSSQGNTSPGAKALELFGLTRSYGTHLALEPLTLELSWGEVTGLIGPNGSGKTTLLRMLLGLMPPTAGRAKVAGVPLTGEGLAVRRVTTYAPGEIGHYGELRLERHLAFLLGGRPRRCLARALEIAETLGLPRGARVRTFSHGMKRQMLLCAALAPDVPMRILDEPTEGLDPTKRGAVLELLRDDLARPGAAGRRAILLSSHHLGEVDRACERLLFLHRGRLLADERQPDLASRARRLLRLVFPEVTEREALVARIDRLGARAVRWSGNAASVELESEDPRPFLASLCAARDLPAPLEVSYGRLSLTELYRELYGAEAV